MFAEDAHAGRFCVDALLYFDRYYFILELKDEIHFGSVLVFPVEEAVAIGCKSLGYIILGETAHKAVVRLRLGQYDLRGHSRLEREQADVAHVYFEVGHIYIRCQRHKTVAYKAASGNEPGKRKPIQRFSEYGRGAAPLHELVLEFSILLGELDGNGIVASANFYSETGSCIFRHVGRIVVQDSVLDVSRGNNAACIDKFLYYRRHSDNDYEYTNRNGTQYNDDDDYTATRQNAEYTDVSGNVQFRMLHGNGSFSTLSVTATRFEGGNPGKEEQQTVVADFVGESALIRYGLESPGFFDDALFLYGGLSYRFDKNVSSSYYPLDHLGYSINEYLEYGAAVYKLVPEVSAEWTLWNRLKGAARLAAEWERAEARGVSKDWALDRLNLVGSGNLYYQFFKYAGLGGEGSVHFLKDHLDEGTFVLPTGGRTLDEAEDRDLTFSGRAYTRLGNSEIPVTGEVSLGRFYQQPALMELYGTFPGALSNPKLKREKATKFEASGLFKVPGKHTSLRAAYFESHIEDGICWVIVVEHLHAENIARSRVRGAEFELNSTPAKFLDVVLRATFQKTEDRSKSDTYNGG